MSLTRIHLQFLNIFSVVAVSLTATLVLAVAAMAQENGTAMAQDNYVTAGSAYNLETNVLLYRELYTALNELGEVRVDYVSPEGNTFATKTLTYQGEYFQPGFVLQDNRDNETVSAQFQGARLVLSHTANGDTREKVIMDNARMVIDAGFDAFIQLHWTELVDDKKRKTFQFALPNRLSSIDLEVRKINPQESPVYSSEFGANWVYLRIAPAQKFISIFANPIFLAYDPNGKYLMRFQGRSNLDDDNGEPVDVRIEYEYLN